MPGRFGARPARQPTMTPSPRPLGGIAPIQRPRNAKPRLKRRLAEGIQKRVPSRRFPAKSSQEPPRTTRRPQSPSQQSDVHSHKFPTMSDRPAAFAPYEPTGHVPHRHPDHHNRRPLASPPPHVPTPPPSATDTSRPSDGSATTRTLARPPSSPTPPDGDPSAETSHGPATHRRPCPPSPTRTHDTHPPSPHSGPSPNRRRPAPPSPDIPRSRGTRRRPDAARRRRLRTPCPRRRHRIPGSRKPATPPRQPDAPPTRARRSNPRAAPQAGSAPSR